MQFKWIRSVAGYDDFFLREVNARRAYSSSGPVDVSVNRPQIAHADPSISLRRSAACRHIRSRKIAVLGRPPGLPLRPFRNLVAGFPLRPLIQVIADEDYLSGS
jgi:hypothetical protein